VLAFSPSGQIDQFGATDQTLMNVLGWDVLVSKKVIQTDGSTSLTLVNNQNYYLFNISSGSGPSLKQNGADVVVGQFGAWTPIGAVQTASGYDVAWKNGSADQYTVWTTDSNGNFLSYNGVLPGGDFALEALESTFNQDLNGDGTIGLTRRVIQTDSSTSLTAVANHFFLLNSGSGPSLKQGGMDVVAGQFGAWTPIGAVQTASGYDVAWKNGGADQYTVWTTDNNGNFLSYNGVLPGGDFALEALESTFNQDLNGDGTIGLTRRVIQTDGSTSLTAVANHFFLLNSGSGPSLKQGGMDVVAGQFGAWTPIGAVQTAAGYDVAWKNGSASQYTIWTTDSNGNFLSWNGVLSGTDPVLESFEPTFGQDLNGDGTIGVVGAAGSASAGSVLNNYIRPTAPLLPEPRRRLATPRRQPTLPY
jgi:hypothetical protein